MSVQQADTDALASLEEATRELVEYVGALRSASAGFALSLPAEWQGPAFARFLAAFEAWSVSAEALGSDTEDLLGRLALVVSAYEAGTEQLTATWQALRAAAG